mmetsp:Transcript_38806/g.97484  ORF Transcript_38806/g.97484 Transcript_38806/m.97484 type:complete len:130 (-) Transcript_38806:1162-1551(-)
MSTSSSACICWRPWATWRWAWTSTACRSGRLWRILWSSAPKRPSGAPTPSCTCIRVALVSLKLFAFVDGEAVALSGYCFGGSVVAFDVFSDSNLKVDVSFHGGLANKPPMTIAPPMKPYLSYQNERRRR